LKTGTFKALVIDYKESPEYHALSPRTQKEYDRHIASLLDPWSELKVSGLKSRHVLQMRDGLKKTPTRANHVIGVLSALIAWGIPRDYAEINPCLDVPKFKKGEGYAPWSWEAIDHFRQNATPEMWHAAALALYTGQRQGDCLEMKWSDIRDGVIAVTQGKTGKEVWVPLHTDLQKILDQIERNSIFILTNSKGQPWKGGFQSSWQKQLKKPEMKEVKDQALVFHGLRKSAVVFLLEAGCTDAEVSAITGQTRQMVEHYSKQVNQRRLASEAILKWERNRNRT